MIVASAPPIPPPRAVAGDVNLRAATGRVRFGLRLDAEQPMAPTIATDLREAGDALKQAVQNPQVREILHAAIAQMTSHLTPFVQAHGLTGMPKVDFESFCASVAVLQTILQQPDQSVPAAITQQLTAAAIDTAVSVLSELRKKAENKTSPGAQAKLIKRALTALCGTPGRQDGAIPEITTVCQQSRNHGAWRALHPHGLAISDPDVAHTHDFLAQFSGPLVALMHERIPTSRHTRKSPLLPLVRLAERFKPAETTGPFESRSQQIGATPTEMLQALESTREFLESVMPLPPTPKVPLNTPPKRK